MNQVTLIGRLGMQPELRYTPNKQAVVNTRIAVTKAKKMAGGGYNYDTYWLTIVAWNKDAETLSRLSKGQRVLVNGELTAREWTGKNNEKRSAVEVVAYRVYPVGDTKGEAMESFEQPAQNLNQSFDTLTEEDIPF